MPHVSDDHVVRAHRERVGQLDDPLLHALDVGRLAARDVDRLHVVRRVDRAAAGQIVLRADHQHGLLVAPQPATGLEPIVGRAVGQVEEVEDDGGLIGLLEATTDADLLDAVRRPVAQARGVDEAEKPAVEGERLLDRVARRAGDVGDDGALLVEQPVQQRRLAHVWSADNGHRQPVSERIAGGERGCQGVDASGDAVGQFAEACAVSKLQLLVIAKVQLQLHERGKFEQLCA